MNHSTGNVIVGHYIPPSRHSCGMLEIEVQIDGKVLREEPSQKILNHSPDGFNWGYGGSGSAQLALAILYHITKDAAISEQLHQSFKWEFIAPLPHEQHFCIHVDVQGWVDQKIREFTIHHIEPIG